MKKPFSILFSVLICGAALFFWQTAGASAAEVKIPTILNPDLQNRHVRWGRPIVVGLSENETKVLVYIDEKYAGEAKMNDGAGSDNFYFQPSKPLNPGRHSIQVMAKRKSDSALSFLGAKSEVWVSDVGAPTIDRNSIINYSAKPLIIGNTVAGTAVDVFIDGKLYGQAKVKSSGGKIDSFAYVPFLDLKKGEHIIYTVAKSMDGAYKSKPSQEMVLKVEHPLPAPILVRTVVNGKTSADKPFVTGVVKSGLSVRVYIDGAYDGEFIAPASKTGVTGFAYLPKKSLDKGGYKIKVEAFDSRGKKSKFSNELNYYHKASSPRISKKAAVETAAVEKKAENSPHVEVVRNEDEKKSGNTASEGVDKGKILGDTVGEIIKSTATPEAKKSGSLNEQKESQSKIKPSLVIFVSFLLIVIGWIVWVNKELVKKEESVDKSEKDKK